MEKIQNNKGITLVALVITIIILLILAGISIVSLTNTGLFGKAQEAREKTSEAEINQKATLDEYETELNKYSDEGRVEGELTAVNIASATNKDEIYGKSVEYTPAGVTTDVGWKIFYSDGTNIYLIADNYVEREALPESTKDGVKTGHKPNDGIHNRDAYFSNIIDDYAGTVNITDTKLQKLNNSFFSQDLTSTYNNMKSVAYMMDTTAWGGYKDEAGKAEYVIGGPTLEMLFDSYNQKYSLEGEKQYKAKAPNNTGYQISIDGGRNWQYYMNSSSEYLNSNDSLYVISSKVDAYAMFVASPAAIDADNIMNLYCGGGVDTIAYSRTDLGFRPLVCLNSKVVLQETNGRYTIK